jgi:hypothetical protein
MSKWHCTISDQKYGPVSSEQLRQWVAEGRLRPNDYVWCEGMTDWAPYNTIAELNYAPATQPTYVQVPVDQGNGMAVAGMVLGIISVVTVCLWPISLILAIIGLCLSIAGKSRSSRTNTGGGMAITGIVLSCVALAMIALLLFAGMAFLRSIPTRYRYR